MSVNLFNAVEFSHLLLKKTLKPGDKALDATAGNGYDTKFLAELVGAEGKVFSFDIQKEAVNNTQKLLQTADLEKNVKIIKASHAELDSYLEDKINAAIFNLGYLPGGDKKIITRAKSTVKALKKTIKLIENDGIVVLVIYSGHPGGDDERDAVLKFVSDLDYKKYNVLNYKFLNQPGPPPQVVAVKKRI
ncbi:class I SAM-dependent methyltransferase [Halanaerobium sp. ST460_2HS_T2]|uniref:tRNA (mnm(5)s(2)U34)-methyltransferase n=1 Tax=Halanaerobium sp. ST460_2HS_T2 TaxID=2183914 RepID=UPI000DF4C995|nr:class I SAM-dependent methyltransferase [Halanaerobium sp. ST460_2HS_T2]RCW55658.1 putative rRNA methylase [Halanaerobium sp. ST460_2HS_T2]